MLRIFGRYIGLIPKTGILVILVCGVLQFLINMDVLHALNISPFLFMTEVAVGVCFYLYYIITSWETLSGAQWAVVAGLFSAIFFGLIWSLVLAVIFTLPSEVPYLLANVLYSAIFLSGPLSLSVYVAMRFKEIIHVVRENSEKVVQLSEEKRQQALNQQQVLQEEVNRQTAELRQTLENLKATQTQLVQSEKMASLGELTAGIAHEIQNPLNFVNNFAEVKKELIEELKSEKSKVKEERDENFEDDILNNISSNLEKISHHGKRVDSIVKGMMQHSQVNIGHKEPTDINALADEYLRLFFHGIRAKDKSFNTEIKTDFDNSIRKINIVPQDIGRVLLNLYNNSFYAVSEKMKSKGHSYEPTVSVSTKKVADKISISVKDNGNGIPQNIIDKIFQPFFTTKPTGQGTGLGLSLSYDIVKAHGGEIKVETKEGEGTTFIIQLPA